MLGLSIADLAFADLLVGNDDGTQWTGVSCKIRLGALQARPGVPVGVTVDLRRRQTEVVDNRPSGTVTVVIGRSAQLWAAFTVALDVIRQVADIVNHRAYGRYLPEDRAPYVRALEQRLGQPAGDVIGYCQQRAGGETVTLKSGLIVAAAPHSRQVQTKVLAELAA
jgi:hypothetical protein